MKKIVLSLSMIGAVAVLAIGATGAFFSDSETSTGNTFAAGAIDLGVDNTSYYNGQFNSGTSWQLSYDMDNCTVPNLETPDETDTLPCLFFNFKDLKPGDWGEDTISLHVNNNDSWLCADVTLTKDDDVSSTEPELDEPGEVAEDPLDNFDGELADNIKWYWWADDGDNVYEDDERLLGDSSMTFPGQPGTYPVTLADSQYNIWGATGPVKGGDTRFIGKAWCFGDSQFNSYPSLDQDAQDVNTSPIERPVTCDGSQKSNITQTDNMMADITFRAVQSRNNA